MEIANKMFNCCLCEKTVLNVRGHNPAPLGEPSGRCCEDCNTFKVIPARMVVMDVAHKLAEWLIENPEWLDYSDKCIARTFEVSDKTVQRAREIVEWTTKTD